jgi:acyl dehydratase
LRTQGRRWTDLIGAGLGCSRDVAETEAAGLELTPRDTAVMTPSWAAAGQAATRTLSAADFAVPIGDRYFEDYQAGAVYEYGYATVDEAELLAFARRFDPQPIHADAQSAAAGPFGGLIASGWHTGAIFMRLFADHYLSRVASLASPGIDELRWPAPVRPGDTLRLRAAASPG